MNGKNRAPKIHRERYDVAAAAALEVKRRAGKTAKKIKPKPGGIEAENARLRELQDRIRARRAKPRPAQPG